MARKRRSGATSASAITHYLVKLETMNEAYKAMQPVAMAQFSTGQRALTAVQNAVKTALAKLSAMVGGEGGAVPPAVVGQVRLELQKVGASYLRYSNEGYSGIALTYAMARTLTRVTTEMYAGTDLNCDQALALAEAVLVELGAFDPGKSPFEVAEEDRVCKVTPKDEPMRPFAGTASTAGYGVPLPDVVNAMVKGENPLTVLTGKSSGGAS